MAFFRLFALTVVLSATLVASIGEIKDLKGAVVISKNMRADANASEINATIGDMLASGDLIITQEKNASAQLELTDGTKITVGGNSQFLVEDYSLEESRAELDLINGTLRVITGSIGKVAPKQFKLKTRTATMGVRGTDFVAVLSEDLTLESACVDGAISVSNEFGEEVVNAGNMSKTSFGSAPSAPFATPAGFLATAGFLSSDEPKIILKVDENQTVIEDQNASDLNASDLNISDIASDPVELDRVKEVAIIRYEDLMISSDLITTDRGKNLEFTAVDSGSEPTGSNVQFMLTSVDLINDIELIEKSKIIVAIYPSETVVLVLEGGVKAWQTEAAQGEMLTNKGAKREFTQKEIFYYFELLGIDKASATPYLPKPKIYKF